MNSATIRIVGPKLNSSVWRSERSPGGSAVTRTRFSSSRPDSSRLFAKVGTSVSKRPARSPSKLVSRLNSPLIVLPWDETSLTLPLRTCSRKKGV